jgi:hypothetical protein
MGIGFAVGREREFGFGKTLARPEIERQRQFQRSSRNPGHVDGDLVGEPEAGYAEESEERLEAAERCEQEQTFFKEAPNAFRKSRSYDATPFYGAGAYDIGLKQWLDEVDAPFSTTLLRLIDERGYDDVDVYKRAGMSRQLFSRIRSDAEYRPAKKTVLALAVALRLNVAEARDLLERAGFALSHSDKRDLVVEYFLENGKHDLMAVNQALYEFDQPLL